MLGKIDAPLNAKLNSVKWGEFRLGDLFEIQTSKKRFDANKVIIHEYTGHPYIVRTEGNNGQKGFLQEDAIFLNKGNTISFGQDTSTIFYQKDPYFTGDKIKILVPKSEKFSKLNAQFILGAMRLAFKNFSWGSVSFSVTTLQNRIIYLPCTLIGGVDFEFMDEFIQSLEEMHIREIYRYFRLYDFDNYDLTEKEQKALSAFSSIVWSEFKIGDLFTKIKTNKLPYKAKDLPQSPENEYIIPCLTSSFMNQGLNYYAPKQGATVLKNVISIPSNSDVYRAYYQSNEFTVLSDAYAIQWKNSSQNILPSQYLFMVACINKVTDLPIYSYKNKLGGWNVVKNKEILLPINDSGHPDLDLMNNFITAIQKILIRDVVKYVDEKLEQQGKQFI